MKPVRHLVFVCSTRFLLTNTMLLVVVLTNSVVRHPPCLSRRLGRQPLLSTSVTTSCQGQIVILIVSTDLVFGRWPSWRSWYLDQLAVSNNCPGRPNS